MNIDLKRTILPIATVEHSRIQNGIHEGGRTQNHATIVFVLLALRQKTFLWWRFFFWWNLNCTSIFRDSEWGHPVTLEHFEKITMTSKMAAKTGNIDTLQSCYNTICFWCKICKKIYMNIFIVLNVVHWHVVYFQYLIERHI